MAKTTESAPADEQQHPSGSRSGQGEGHELCGQAAQQQVDADECGGNEDGRPWPCQHDGSQDDGQQTRYELRFPQALLEKAIHQNLRFIDGMVVVISVSTGSADPSIVGCVSAGVDGATVNSARRLMFPMTSAGSTTGGLFELSKADVGTAFPKTADRVQTRTR
jgi:hypothetical protein